MAVGDGSLPDLFPVAGIKLGISSAGIKTPGRKDVVLLELCEGAEVAAVFTRNAFCAAPVSIAKAHLQQGDTRLLLVNTGNANAGTGQRGLADALLCCKSLSEQADCAVHQVLPFSTGVIGEPLPVEKIAAAMPDLIAGLADDRWAEAAAGIMTTDTRPKAASRRLQLGGETVTITGMAKGAGMIKPNMATMLAYVATDAAIPEAELQALLNRVNERSFNRITVDGDTSTNDACVLVASGAGKVDYSALDDADRETLEAQLQELFIELAQGLVRDGEGASKFVGVRVDGGASVEECLAVAYTVAESPLVKTALFASDPNWGRILAAIGRAGVAALDVDRISVRLNGVLIAEQGGRASSYTEAAGQAVMDQEEIEIAIDLQRGSCSETVWTTDLSHDYVRINAEYRT